VSLFSESLQEFVDFQPRSNTFAPESVPPLLLASEKWGQGTEMTQGWPGTQQKAMCKRSEMEEGMASTLANDEQKRSCR